jgi:hypothetical protein
MQSDKRYDKGKTTATATANVDRYGRSSLTERKNNNNNFANIFFFCLNLETLEKFCKTLITMRQ